MAKKKTASRRNKQDRFMVYMISFIVILIMVVVAVKSMDIRAQLAEQTAKREELTEIKEEEQALAKELEEMEKTVKTKGFAEEVARDVLGMGYEDEIQFVEEK